MLCKTLGSIVSLLLTLFNVVLLYEHNMKLKLQQNNQRNLEKHWKEYGDLCRVQYELEFYENAHGRLSIQTIPL